MNTRLMGVESEYALAGGGGDADFAMELVDTVRDRIPQLRGLSETDMFLENGSRFYIDTGGHPEMSTPECSSPTDIVRYILAGERILADMVSRLPVRERSPIGPALFKCNVDYSGSRTTWGSHESYMHRSSPARFPEQIIPHLVSRVVFTGAGGFNPFSAGIDFTLSPRAWHLRHVVSPESTDQRGIFHTKDETLSGTGSHRLHLLCGESLCSQIATWLRIGTTAIVVAMIDAGLNPGACVNLESPLEALGMYAADPDCKATAMVRGGAEMSAVGIQRHYLRLAQRHLGDGFMPPWAEEVCERWQSLLDRIEEDPQSLSSTLDWALKLAIYKGRIERHGLEWTGLPAWTHIAETISKALRKAKHKGKAPVELVLGKGPAKNPIPDTIEQLTPFLDKHSLSWDMLKPFVELRRQLFEVDVRFGQLGEKGIFAELDRAGVLDHRAPGVENIDEARTNPPATSRARLRAEAVRSHARDTRYMCSWTAIWDYEGERMMDFSDPFESEVKWKKMPREEFTMRRLHGLPEF